MEENSNGLDTGGVSKEVFHSDLNFQPLHEFMSFEKVW